MSKSVVFNGVKTTDNRMVGFIRSADIIDNFSKDWIPEYQRERVERTKKIEELKTIFRTNGPIDTVKLSVRGSITPRWAKGAAETEFLLQGEYHVIDGQQRIWALTETEVRDYNLPVELYVNLAESEEVDLFHQYNTDGTQLSFGELAKSYTGPLAEIIKRLMKSRSYPIKLSVNSSTRGLTLGMFVPLMYWSFSRLTSKNPSVALVSPRAGLMKRFLQDTEITPKECNLLEFATRSLVETFVDLFGEYDNQARAYKRSFFLAFMRVLINHFMDDKGNVKLGKFKSKAQNMEQFFRKARVREVISMGGSDSFIVMYDLIIEHFNFKLKTDRLETFEETKESWREQRAAANQARREVAHRNLS